MKNDKVNLVGGSLQGVSLPAQASVTPIENSLAIAGHGQIMGYVKNAQGVLGWNLLLDATPALYEFTTFTFTPAGDLLGRTGPTYAQLGAVYGSALFMQSQDRFYVTGSGLQNFVVPSPGTYEIVARGASQTTGYPAAQVSCRVVLTQGEILTFAVGQRGSDPIAGCGASYVTSSARGVLLVAGGAGGSRNNNGSTLNNSTLTDTATTRPSGQGGAGANIQQGVPAAYGGGGAGYDLNGTVYRGTGHIDALAYVAGSVGGFGQFSGGFGGGGSGDFTTNKGDGALAVGGGGGYVGGDSAAASTSTAAAAALCGGSFVTSRDVSARALASAATRGPGSVKITKIA